MGSKGGQTQLPTPQEPPDNTQMFMMYGSMMSNMMGMMEGMAAQQPTQYDLPESVAPDPIDWDAKYAGLREELNKENLAGTARGRAYTLITNPLLDEEEVPILKV